MNLDFVAYSNKYSVDVNPELTTLIKKDALKANWPSQVIKLLKVSTKDLNITVYYPEKYEKLIDDLEYGSQDESPRSVFRRFVDKHETFILNTLTEDSVNYLFDSEVLP